MNATPRRKVVPVLVVASLGVIAIIASGVVAVHLTSDTGTQQWIVAGTAGVVGLVLVLLPRGSGSPNKREAEARERLRSAEDQFASALVPDILAEHRDDGEPEVQGTDSPSQPSSSQPPGHIEADAYAKLAEADWQLADAKRKREELDILISKQEDRLALSALWAVTHRRLDLYHQIATDQARRSFLTAQAAAGLGFLMLIGFAVLAFNTHSTAAAITTGGLGAVSAALAGYIGRTFVRSQESAAEHLRAYFDQPLEFANFLAAERLLASQQDLPAAQRSDMLDTIIRAMVASPGPDPVGARSNGHPPGRLRKARAR